MGAGALRRDAAGGGHRGRRDVSGLAWRRASGNFFPDAERSRRLGRAAARRGLPARVRHPPRLRRSWTGSLHLAWVERTCIAAGKTWLRLDCVAWNEPLNDYYRRAGFAYRRAVGVYNPVNLYEKRLWGAWNETPDISIALAGPADLDALVEIDASASAWSDAIGRPGGSAPRPLRDIFAETIMRGEAWIARWQGERAGKITLQWEDTAVWGQTPWDAVYVHGLSTHRDFAGKGVGLALLRWAERAAEAAGRSYVRLDCNADNPELRAYYERAGFADIEAMLRWAIASPRATRSASPTIWRSHNTRRINRCRGGMTSRACW